MMKYRLFDLAAKWLGIRLLYSVHHIKPAEEYQRATVSGASLWSGTSLSEANKVLSDFEEDGPRKTKPGTYYIRASARLAEFDA